MDWHVVLGVVLKRTSPLLQVRERLSNVVVSDHRFCGLCEECFFEDTGLIDRVLIFLRARRAIPDSWLSAISDPIHVDTTAEEDTIVYLAWMI